MKINQKTKRIISSMLSITLSLGMIISGSKIAFADSENPFIYDSEDSNKIIGVNKGITEATIPSPGSNTITLGDGFLSGSNIKKLKIPSGNIFPESNAFYNAPKDIIYDTSESNIYVYNNYMLLDKANESVVLDVTSDANNNIDLTGKKALYSIDNLNLNELDLGDCKSYSSLTFANTNIKLLTLSEKNIPDNAAVENDRFLFGANIESFKLNNTYTSYLLCNGTVYTFGTKMTPKDMAKVIEQNDCNLVSPYAFNSREDAIEVWNLLSTDGKNKIYNTVFNFLDDYAFVVGGKIAYCHDMTKLDPYIADVEFDGSNIIGDNYNNELAKDEQRYRKIVTLMQVGYPNNIIGIWDGSDTTKDDFIAATHLAIYMIIDDSEACRTALQGSSIGIKLLNCIDNYEDYTNFSLKLPDYDVTLSKNTTTNTYVSSSLVVGLMGDKGEITDSNEEFMVLPAYNGNPVDITDGALTANWTEDMWKFINTTYKTNESFCFNIPAEFVDTDKGEFSLVYLEKKPDVTFFKQLNDTDSKYQGLLMPTTTLSKTNFSTKFSTKYIFNKVDSVTGEYLPGAIFKVTNETGEEKIFTTDANGKYEINFEKTGNYTLSEIEAPFGYEKANDISFTVEYAVDGNIVIKDNPIKGISKVDNEGNAVIGAVLSLYKEDTSAVIDTNTVNTTSVTNTATKSNATKSNADEEENEEISDGEVENTIISTTATRSNSALFYSNNNTLVYDGISYCKIDSFTTDGSIIETTFEPANYLLVEDTAPEGYELADPVRFTVNRGSDTVAVKMIDVKKSVNPTPEPTPATPSAPDKKHTSGGSSGGGSSPSVITTKTTPKTMVSLSKQSTTGSSELPGAELSLYRIEVDGTLTLVDEWISTTVPHYIEGLAVGGYRWIEKTAPNGYQIAESMDFSLEADGVVKYMVMKDAPIVTPNLPSMPKTGDSSYYGLLMIFIGIIGFSASMINFKKMYV